MSRRWGMGCASLPSIACSIIAQNDRFILALAVYVGAVCARWLQGARAQQSMCTGVRRRRACASASAEIKDHHFSTSGGSYRIRFVFASVWEPKQRTLPSQCDQPDSLSINSALVHQRGLHWKRYTFLAHLSKSCNFISAFVSISQHCRQFWIRYRLEGPRCGFF